MSSASFISRIELELDVLFDESEFLSFKYDSYLYYINILIIYSNKLYISKIGKLTVRIIIENVVEFVESGCHQNPNSQIVVI